MNQTWNIDEALKKLCEQNKERKFKETIEVQLGLNLTSKNIGKVKKKNWIFSTLFPHTAGRSFNVKALAQDPIVVSKIGDNANTIEIINGLKKKQMDFDCLLAVSSLMSKITQFNKKLATQQLLPKDDEGTLLKSDKELLSRYEEFVSGQRKNLKFSISNFASSLNAPVGTLDNIDNIKENIVFILETLIAETIPEKLDTKKRFKITSFFIKSTMGHPVQVNINA